MYCIYSDIWLLNNNIKCIWISLYVDHNSKLYNCVTVLDFAWCGSPQFQCWLGYLFEGCRNSGTTTFFHFQRIPTILKVLTPKIEFSYTHNMVSNAKRNSIKVDVAIPCHLTHIVIYSIPSYLYLRQDKDKSGKYFGSCYLPVAMAI